MSRLILLFVFPLVSVAQVRPAFFAEAGAAANFPHQETTVIEEYTFGADWTSTNHLAAGSFIRLGTDMPLYRGKTFVISAPLTGYYSHQKSHIEMRGSEYGCFTSFSGERNIRSSRHVAGLSAGIKLNTYLASGFRFFTGIALYPEISFGEHTYVTQTNEAGTETFDYGTSRPALYTTVSLDNGIMYDLNKNTGIGLVANVQAFEFAGLIKAARLNNHRYFMFSHRVADMVINTGVRVEYRF